MDKLFWFDKARLKFLHNVDTLYYSAAVYENFLADTKETSVLNYRQDISKYENNEILKCFPEYDREVIFHKCGGSFSRFFPYMLEIGDDFNVFFSLSVPEHEDSGKSITPSFLIQIRSKLLWDKGVLGAYEYTKVFLDMWSDYHNLHIKEIVENRADFCFHTNYFRRPEKYFNDDLFLNRCVCSIGRSHKEGNYAIMQRKTYDQKNKKVTMDYIAIGKRSNRCFLRIYNKTKEVVQEGYKSFFFYVWFFNRMISRYDLYVLEKCYLMQKWTYVDIARAEWILENYDLPDLDRSDKEFMQSAINGDKINLKQLHTIVKKYTPELTQVYNIEFQLNRKMTKTFQLYEFKKNDGIDKRLRDFIDNHGIISKYVTNDCFRIVVPGNDTNLSRAPYSDFWNRLRNTKLIDCDNSDHKLIRKYSYNIDMDIRKKRVVRNISSFALLLNHNLNSTIYEDAVDIISMLNDNDIHEMYSNKRKNKSKIKDAPVVDLTNRPDLGIINKETGEIL